jgi:hypothetical protein
MPLGWWYKPEYIINELNINSVITTPSHGQVVPINAQSLQAPFGLEGYAYSGRDLLYINPIALTRYSPNHIFLWPTYLRCDL